MDDSHFINTSNPIGVAHWLINNGKLGNIISDRGNIKIFSEETALWISIDRNDLNIMVENAIKDKDQHILNKSNKNSFFIHCVVGNLPIPKNNLLPKNHVLPILDKKIIDLMTNEVRMRTKEDNFIRSCNVKYDPTADSTELTDF